ncbi:MAG TPA: M14 family zinc carboxypeptidase [Phycisphaerae bacterium]|nr:M14 family zinc carboxypeptidase [Phycisphaerae bacterium]
MSMPINDHKPLDRVLRSDTPTPPWWTSREHEIQHVLDTEIRVGVVRELSVSPGGRSVKLVEYGRPEPELRGQANFNSALGAGSPDAFFRRGPGVRTNPVLLLMAGVHGAEVEGMMGCLSAIRILESGRDIVGREQSRLAAKLARLRLLIVPLANPDGRARVPYDGWVGLPAREMHRVAQGTRRDGSLWGWPGCKTVHPMRGDIGFLGGYFDDAGVNMMHDEWPAPMSSTTKAVLDTIRQEAPDIFINLHSHEAPPSVLPTAYVATAVKHDIAEFAAALHAGLDDVDLAHAAVPAVREDGPRGTVPPALNLTSMAWHTGAALSMTFESAHGFADAKIPFDYDQILRIHHILFETAADRLLPAT